ncbi:bifunctional Phosphatidylinositol 3--4-kinase [Babesia duncani]|uniref:Bifunctional Phosphatidylinositol 3--4-kinase n=1 Tax=Babesia duncani TaxID=323732 RepID=A0AAD9PML5_9APIC|nr:bifunctional Phosphatidylinositol 3--4-kinase [Babesia duncani]
MDLKGHVYKCHLASLQSDVIPPNPADYIGKGIKNKIQISLGSLVLYKILKPQQFKRSGSLDDSFAWRKPPFNKFAYTNEKCVEIKQTTRITLKCTLYDGFTKLADTVFVHVNTRGDARRITLENDAGQKQQITKHRYTFFRKPNNSGTANTRGKVFTLSHEREKLNPTAKEDQNSTCCFPFKFPRKRGQRLLLLPPKDNVASHENKETQDPTQGSLVQDINKNMKHCRGCMEVTNEPRRGINKPLVIPVCCIISFEPKASIKAPFRDLKMYCQVYLDDLEIAVNHITLDCTRSGFVARSLCFYSNAKDNCETAHAGLNKGRCCCNWNKRQICTLHTLWIIQELNRLLTHMVVPGGNAKARFLFYLYLQFTRYMQHSNIILCKAAGCCPCAILTLSTVTKSRHSYPRDTCAKDALILSRLLNAREDVISQAFENIPKVGKLKRAAFVHLEQYATTPPPCNQIAKWHEHFIVSNVNKSNATCGVGGVSLCKCSIDIIVQFSDMFKIGSRSLVHLIEPPELLVLKRLTQIPMYGSCMQEGIADEKSNKTRFTRINELIWKYYAVLNKSNKCLATFLRFVKWNRSSEAFDAILLLRCWERPSTESLIELLSPDFAPPNVPKYVRKFLVQIAMKQMSHGDILQFQAPLLYSAISLNDKMDPLLLWLMHLGTTSVDIGVANYWILVTAFEMGLGHSPRFKEALERLVQMLANSTNAVAKEITSILKAQRSFRDCMLQFANGIKHQWPRNIGARNELLHHFLSEFKNWPKFNSGGLKLKNGVCVPLFTDPSVEICGIEPSGSKILGSTSSPLVLQVNARHNCNTKMRDFHLLLKRGDDVRLDQLCQMLCGYFHKVLQKHGLESHLVCYKVSAIGPKYGCIQYLTDCLPLSDILQQYKSLGNYLETQGDKMAQISRRKKNLVDSLASYSVLTFILGVGDRHHDNILISKDGHLVHVDYSFVFGADPKPLPLAPFRLSGEIVNFIGGTQSPMYRRLQVRLFKVFQVIRAHSKPIIQLLYHSLSAQMPNLTLDAIATVKAKLALGLDSAQELQKYTNELLEASRNALFPAVVEHWHQWVTRWTL